MKLKVIGTAALVAATLAACGGEKKPGLTSGQYVKQVCECYTGKANGVYSTAEILVKGLTPETYSDSIANVIMSQLQTALAPSPDCDTLSQAAVTELRANPDSVKAIEMQKADCMKSLEQKGAELKQQLTDMSAQVKEDEGKKTDVKMKKAHK